MTPAALSDRIDALVAELQQELRLEVERAAQTGLAMVTQRVSETGKDAKGASFKPYTRPYELRKRAATGNVKKEGKKKRAARRSAEASAEKPVGRYRGFVDFTFTGQMLSSAGLDERGQPKLKNMGILKSTNSGGRVVVVVGARDQETQMKMDGNDKHRPGWFRLSKEEVDILAQQSGERLGRYINGFLN